MQPHEQHEASKLRATAHRKIAEGHKLLGKAIEVGNLHTKQSADNHYTGHKLIAQGYEMLARAEEMMLDLPSNPTLTPLPDSVVLVENEGRTVTVRIDAPDSFRLDKDHE